MTGMKCVETRYLHIKKQLKYQKFTNIHHIKSVKASRSIILQFQKSGF